MEVEDRGAMATPQSIGLRDFATPSPQQGDHGLDEFKRPKTPASLFSDWRAPVKDHAAPKTKSPVQDPAEEGDSTEEEEKIPASQKRQRSTSEAVESEEELKELQYSEEESQTMMVRICSL